MKHLLSELPSVTTRVQMMRSNQAPQSQSENRARSAQSNVRGPALQAGQLQTVLHAVQGPVLSAGTCFRQSMVVPSMVWLCCGSASGGPQSCRLCACSRTHQGHVEHLQGMCVKHPPATCEARQLKHALRFRRPMSRA